MAKIEVLAGDFPKGKADFNQVCITFRKAGRVYYIDVESYNEESGGVIELHLFDGRRILIAKNDVFVRMLKTALFDEPQDIEIRRQRWQERQSKGGTKIRQPLTLGKILSWGLVAFFGLGILGNCIGPQDRANTTTTTPTAQVAANTSQNQHSSDGTNKVENPTPPVTPSKWRYGQDQDEMRNQATYYAVLESNNTVDFDFPYSGGSSLSIQLRQDPKYGKDVIFSISKGQIPCFSGCRASIKFDNGRIQTFNFTGAENGHADIIFLSNNVAGFVKQLRSSKTMMVEVEFYNEGRRQFQFDTSGLEWKHF